MTKDSEWVARLRVGMPVVFDGELVFVRSWADGWVQFVDAANRLVTPRPLRAVAKALASPGNPPPVSMRLHNLESHLSERALDKRDDHRALIRFIDSGIAPWQGAEEAPTRDVDPKIIRVDQKRLAAVARRIAEHDEVSYEAARKRIRRALQREAAGPAATVDGRFIRERSLGRNTDIPELVERFLLERVFDPALHTQTQYLEFRLWMTQNATDVKESPSERTFYRLVGRLHKRMPHLKTKSKTKHGTEQAPKQSFAPRHPERPGSLWQIDATTSNVMLWDPKDRSGKGRCYRVTLVKIIDSATRMIVGRSITEHASGVGAVLALADAFASMVDDRETVTVDGRVYPRPFVGLPRALTRWPIPPRRLITDNGKDFLSAFHVAQLARLGCEVEFARIRDPRAKALIERSFLSYKTEFEEFCAGYVGGSTDERGLDTEALLTWEQLWERDQQWTDLYNFREHRGLRAELGRRISPYQRWAELVGETGFVEMPKWENEWIRFLPTFTSKLRKYGITRRQEVFNAPILETLLRTPGATRDGNYTFHYNPSDLRQVYCFDPDGAAWEVPWVLRTEDTPRFSDHSLTAFAEQTGDLTMRRFEYQDRILQLLIQWRADDALLRANRSELSRTDEMTAAAYRRLQSLDSGTVIPSDMDYDLETILDEAGNGGDDDFDDLDELDDLFGRFA